jgi:transcriptional regulator of PTS gene
LLGHIAAIHEGTRYRVKDREKAAIYEQICTCPDTSRKSIAKRCGLRPNTVSSAVQELISDGLVREGPARSPGRSGRPELSLGPDYNRLAALSVYVRSRELEGVLVNLGDRVLAENSHYIPEESTEEGIRQLILDLVESLRRQAPPGGELLGLGISLVGTIVPERKLWRFVARWPKIHMLDFHRVEAEAGLPVSLRRIHDTELEYLIEQNDTYRRQNIILFHWGFGIGAAYAHAGRVLGSTSGEFGEIGHTVVDPTSRKRCQCGLFGCLETEASLWALLPDIRRIHPGVSESDQQMLEALQRREILSFPPFRRALEFLTVGLVNLQRLLNADRILFIGPFTENEEIFRRLASAFRQRLPQHTRAQVALEVIHGGFSGCGFGSAYPFFRGRLRELLKARYP